MTLLEVKNLHVEVEGKQILNGLTLTVEKGQVAAIMGPNGSGKSTLAYVLAGKDGYEVTEGDVLLDGESILALAPDERAAKGVFLAFQYPVEVPGVATMTFLRTALNAQRKHARRGRSLDAGLHEAGARDLRASSASVRRCCAARSMSASPAARRSGTKYCRWRCWSRASRCSTRPTPGSTSTRCKIVAEGVNRLRSPERSMVVITHYQRLLNYIVPDVVHVLAKGQSGEVGRQGTGA